MCGNQAIESCRRRLRIADFKHTSHGPNCSSCRRQAFDSNLARLFMRWRPRHLAARADARRCESNSSHAVHFQGFESAIEGPRIGVNTIDTKLARASRTTWEGALETLISKER